MTEATWGETTKTPDIDWRMSASLENVSRGDSDLAEVTSLERAVRAWTELEPDHQRDATLKPERSVMIGGAAHHTFVGEGVRQLVDRLPVRQ